MLKRTSKNELKLGLSIQFLLLKTVVICAFIVFILSFFEINLPYVPFVKNLTGWAGIVSLIVFGYALLSLMRDSQTFYINTNAGKYGFFNPWLKIIGFNLVKKGRVKDIHALQVLSEWVEVNDDDDYKSYEVNLVLKSGMRVNVIDHCVKEIIFDEAQTLAKYLKVPIWRL